MASSNHGYSENKNQKLLARKLLVYILLFSAIFTISSISFQLFLDYKRDVGEIDKQIKLIENSYIRPLVEHIWAVDRSQAEIVLTSILNLPDIQYVELVDSTTEVSISLGEKTDLNSSTHRFKLEHVISKAETVSLGYLSINTSLDNVYARLRDRVLTISVTQSIKTFFVALFIFLITNRLITRHLATISKHATTINLNTLDHPLELRRKPSKASQPDELDQVVSSLNDMHARILSDITASKQAEEELIRNRQMLTEMGKIGKIGGWEFNVDTREVWWTEEVYHIHEVSSDYDLNIEAGIDFYSDTSKPLITEAVQRAIEQGESYDLELEIITAKGNLRKIHTVGIADLEHRRVLGIIQDITERKRTEEDLKVSRLMMARAGHLASMGSWEWDIANDAWTFDENWLQIHGVSSPTASSEELLQIAHPDDVPRIEKIFADCVESGTPYQIEHRIIRLDTAEERSIQAYGEPMLNDAGKVVSIRGAALDVTERHKAEEALKHQKATLESLFDSIPDAIILADTDRHIVSINNGFTDIFGYTLDEVRGKQTSVLYASEEEFLKQGRLRYNLSSKEAAKPYVVSYKSKDGTLLPGETIGKKMLSSTGEPLGFVGLIRDISDKLRQEEAHRQALKMEAIGILSGGIAHDFNNLLAIISSNIDIIHHKQQTGTTPEENIGNIKETVSRAKNLVAQILAFSRQEKHELSPVDLTIVVADFLKLLRSTIPVSVEILVEVESDSVFINADTTQIQQVLINLCTNAVHAMDEKGLLRVSLVNVESGSHDLPESLSLQPGCYAKLSISDTGCGIDREHITRIFDPFFTTKDVGKGTGMGLSAAYGIVEQHGGIITVDSTPGQGTTFNIYFPFIEAQQQKTKADVKDSLPTGTERILFVDDEESIAESCCELLEYQGYTVSSTISSIEALELFQKTPADFDLVFTDQTMPGMTGVELAEELLKIRPDIPIILCSGYAAKVSEDVVKGIGIREFCMKPMDLKQLVTVARKVLDENDSSS